MVNRRGNADNPTLNIDDQSDRAGSGGGSVETRVFAIGQLLLESWKPTKLLAQL